MTEKFVFTAM